MNLFSRGKTDSLGKVEVPADKLWGLQTQRSLEHFSIGRDLIPRKMITAHATLKKAAANANTAGGRLGTRLHDLIVRACDEILAGANVVQSITLLGDGCTNFRRFLVEGTQPNPKKIAEYVERSLMLVTALVPVIGDDKASKIAHHALDHDVTLREAALQLGYVDERTFDRIVDPAKMVMPYVAGSAA